jgi:hypothetical protein
LCLRNGAIQRSTVQLFERELVNAASGLELRALQTLEFGSALGTFVRELFYRRADGGSALS